MVGRCAGRAAKLLATLLLVALVWGCGGGDGTGTVPDDDDDNGGNPPPPAVATRTVTGFVGDITSGAGIVAATVTIGDSAVQTGVNGLFTLRDVPRSNQAVEIRANGYVTHTSTLSGNTDQITIRLVPSGAGSIENPPGAPGI